MSASPIVAYLRWHAREALPRLITPLVLFIVLGGLPLWMLARAAGFDALALDGSQAHEQARMMYTQTLMSCITIGSIVVASGFISLDREKQYFRFLFSHPVVPWRFYLQKFAVTVLLFAATMLLVPLGFGLLFFEVPVLPVATASLVYGLLYGSVALLCGALFNRDGVAFIAIIVVVNVLQGSRAMLPRWLAEVSDALPPFRVADTVRRSMLDATAVDVGDLVHVLAYSVGMLVAALVLVRRTPLAR